MDGAFDYKATLPRNSHFISTVFQLRKRKVTEILPKPKIFVQGEDEFDLFGKSVALSLRKLSPFLRLGAKKQINDVLYEAELEEIALSAVPNADSYDQASDETATGAKVSSTVHS